MSIELPDDVPALTQAFIGFVFLTLRSRAAASSGAAGSVAANEYLEPHRDPGVAHALLRLAHAVLPVVEDRGAEHGVGASLAPPPRRDGPSLPAPPLAITGTSTASDAARVRSSS